LVSSVSLFIIMSIKSPSSVENYIGMLSQLDKNKKGNTRNQGAVESL